MPIIVRAKVILPYYKGRMTRSRRYDLISCHRSGAFLVSLWKATRSCSLKCTVVTMTGTLGIGRCCSMHEPASVNTPFPHANPPESQQASVEEPDRIGSGKIAGPHLTFDRVGRDDWPACFRLLFASPQAKALGCRNASPDPNTPSSRHMQNLRSADPEPHSRSSDPAGTRAL
jgi:hypothetical protein